MDSDEDFDQENELRSFSVFKFREILLINSHPWPKFTAKITAGMSEVVKGILEMKFTD